MEKRPIDGCEPAAPMIVQAAYNVTEYLGMPIDLQIAATMMAARITGCAYAGFTYDSDKVSTAALKDARALIAAYNRDMVVDKIAGEFKNCIETVQDTV